MSVKHESHDRMLRIAHNWKKLDSRHWILGLILFFTVINDAYRLDYIVKYMRGRVSIVQSPIGVRLGTANISWVTSNAAVAGIKASDVLLEVNGVPYRGSRVLNRAICSAKLDDTFEIKVRSNEPGGAERTVRIHLSPWKK